MTRGVTAALAAAALSALAAGTAAAGTLSGGAGADYAAGPNAQSYRGALLYGTAEGTRADITLAAIRFDDSTIGPGTAGIVHAGLRVATGWKLRGMALRSIGDHVRRGWRLRAGPEVELHAALTMGAYYVRQDDDSPAIFQGGTLEATAPLTPTLSGRAGSTLGRWTGGARTSQGMLGAVWAVAPRVQLLCEVDLGRNVVTTSTAGSTGGGALGGLPLPGGLGGGGSGSESRTEETFDATGSLGVRFSMP